MAEEFLTLMADLDGDSQAVMSGWYTALREAGFTGTQTPGLPYHISLATFPLTKEREAAALPVFVKSFYPFIGKIVRLHLCAFWPAREIASIDLQGLPG